MTAACLNQSIKYIKLLDKHFYNGSNEVKKQSELELCS